jgi:stage IV sporulation protein FB
MAEKRAAVMMAAAALIIIAGIYSRDIWLSFIFVLVHEIVHIAVARLLGYSWGRINLLPFGTSAVLKEEFVRPLDDMLISSAGPLINFAFFCLFSLLSSLNPNKINVINTSWSTLERINLVLCGFNLMPGEFLDGGRIIKSLLKLYAGFIWSYIAVFCGGIITGGILVSGLIYYKLTINGIIIFSLGVYILWATIHNVKSITLGIIKDELYKQDYIKGLKRITIITIGVCGKEKIVDVIKRFCFKKYYNVCLMDKNQIMGTINEKQLYILYCSYGNITIEDCFTHIKT